MRALLPVLVAVLTATAVAEVGAPSRREAQIALPGVVAPGRPVEIGLRARTAAGGGERIGFLHAEVSRDGGRSWTPLAMEQDLPAEAARTVTVVAPESGAVVVRLRVAFRGGLAGDVDQRGAALRWNSDWVAWRSPPAVVARATVGTP